MKIQLLSDLHIEFQPFDYLDNEADVVVLAGDIHLKTQGLQWAIKHIDKPVIYVMGNHEYYGAAYPRLLEKARPLLAGTQVHLLENDCLTLDGVNFLGCTLWSDFELYGNARTSGYHCQQVMNDYKKIRRSPGYSKMRSIDTALIHRHSRDWLAKQLIEKVGQTNVVVSHHGPSEQSVPAQYLNHPTTAAYVSSLEAFIEQCRPDYWLHGHLHASSDYWIGDCRVLSNPRGYPGEENTLFDAGMCFEL